MIIQGVTYPSDFEAKKSMIEAARLMAVKEYVIAGDGSLSVRVGPNAVWITEDGADKGTLTQDKFIRVDMNGKQMLSNRSRRLPADVMIHLKLYEQNDTLRSVIHAYSPGAIVLAAKGCGVHAADYTPSVRRLGSMHLLTASSTEETARQAAMMCKNDNGILVSGDGCVLWGTSVQEAYQRIVALEFYAKIEEMLDTSKMQERSEAKKVYDIKDAYIRAEETVNNEMIPEGLTPVIRPGEKGFVLPGGKAEKSSERPAVAAVTKEVEPTVNQTSFIKSDAFESKKKAMAEIVRRSVNNMKQ